MQCCRFLRLCVSCFSNPCELATLQDERDEILMLTVRPLGFALSCSLVYLLLKSHRTSTSSFTCVNLKSVKSVRHLFVKFSIQRQNSVEKILFIILRLIGAGNNAEYCINRFANYFPRGVIYNSSRRERRRRLAVKPRTQTGAGIITLPSAPRHNKTTLFPRNESQKAD